MIAERISAQMKEIGNASAGGTKFEILRKVCFADVCGIKLETKSLIRGLSSHCKIVMIGDDHQLPSVGPGQLLHDLISSEKLTTVKLKELYRQGKDSNIITLAYDMRNGKVMRDVFNKEEDLTFISCTPDQVINHIKEISETYDNFYGIIPTRS